MNVASGTLLRADGLYVARGGLPILRDVSIHVDAAQAVAVLGGNGSGKTTLIRTLVGLIPFQEGSVELFSTPIATFHEWCKVGYVPQHASLNVQHATVQEVVNAGRLAHVRPFQPLRQADRAAVAEALERVELSDRARWPFHTLSGGQKQRTLIARALATQPELLIMDEPFAGVDIHSQRGLAQLLAGLRDHGLGMVMVLHETALMSDVLDAHITLCDGRIVESEVPGLTATPQPHRSRSVMGWQDPAPRSTR